DRSLGGPANPTVGSRRRYRRVRGRLASAAACRAGPRATALGGADRLSGSTADGVDRLPRRQRRGITGGGTPCKIVQELLREVFRATLLNAPLAFLPSVVIAPMQTTMIRASITAYSTAVGPSSFLRNATMAWA